MRELSAAVFMQTIRAGDCVHDAKITEPVVLARQNFEQPVSVSNVEFLQAVNLQDVRFTRPLQFEACIFQQGLAMTNCTFEDDATFRGSHFEGKAYFWRTYFEKRATFDDVVVNAAKNDRGSVDPGEFNVSWAHFKGPASLVRLRVHGAGHFWRATFGNDVILDESLFENGFRFMGLWSEVSIDLMQKGGLQTYDALEPTGLLRPDPEVMLRIGNREFRRFAQLAVRSASELEKKLAGTTISRELQKDLLEEFQKRSVPMFTPGKRVSFCRVENGLPDRSFLIDVEMSPCCLRGTPMSGVLLSRVRWPERSMLCSTVQRNATADEVEPLDRAARTDLRRLYRDLASSYEAQADTAEAIRFRIGEREVSRADLPHVARLLATLERLLSAYGTSPGIALFWLALFVLVLFPIAILLVARFIANPLTGDITLLDLPGAIVHSLEVSAFLEDSNAQYSLPLRFLAGIERIVATAQLALFVRSLRAISWRDPT
jgi:hypothetical protein